MKIEYFLKDHKKLELIFSSPSVEEKCIRLVHENPNQLNILIFISHE